jgi:hypothetical protein
MVVTLWAHSEYIAVAEMGFLSRGAYRKGVLALVAQRDLWLTLAACGLFFVSALFGLAAWGMRAMEFADAGGLTDAPAVVPRSSGFESVDIVRPAELLDRPDHGGLFLSPTVASETSSSNSSSTSSGLDDAPPDAVTSRSADTVEPKDVHSGVVNMVESSPLGPAALTPATANRRITKVVRATAR